jgi:cysteine desulfurase
MIRALEADGVYVSGGSACAKGARSHVLLAQGVSPKAVDSALRISFSHHTNQQDIERFVTAFEKACRILHRKR